MSANGWTSALNPPLTSAPNPPLNPEWEAARLSLNVALFYWQCMHRWGAGPTPQQARWIPTVERIIERREADLRGLRP